MAKLFCVLIAITFFQASTAGPLNPSLAPPETTITNGGEDFTFQEDQPNLGYEDVSRVCKTGIWIIYTGQDYTTGSGWGYSVFDPTLGYSCYSPNSGRLGSTRLAGFRSNYTAPSVTLYSDSGMQDHSVVFNDGVPEIDFQVGSLITISAQVELFKQPNYEGESFCVAPNPDKDCRGEVCWVQHWSFYGSELPWDVSFAKSAKFGCESATKSIRSGIPTHRHFVEESDNTIYYNNVI